MTTATSAGPKKASPSKSSRKKQIIYGVLGGYLVGLVIIAAAFGFHGQKNENFNIVSPFHLDTWFKIAGPIDFNKGVLYLLITASITLGIMLYVASRMKMKPNRVQTAVEWIYDLTRTMTKENMDEDMARKWFPLVCTLFVFILVTNLLGYLPLPVDSEEKLNIGGHHIPSFQLYAADTNVALPLILATGVFIAYNVEGLRAHGLMGYIKSLVPTGVGKGMLIMIYPLEILSHFLRLLSLTVRLWANLLAGHLLIDFMAGDMAVLLGLPALGWITLPLGVAIFLFECALIAGLQAFIFAILTAIYLGSAVRHH
jgi:F-type H+-transporting ATPase subunit a